jgi:hypothetical protein
MGDGASNWSHWVGDQGVSGYEGVRTRPALKGGRIGQPYLAAAGAMAATGTSGPAEAPSGAGVAEGAMAAPAAGCAAALGGATFITWVTSSWRSCRTRVFLPTTSSVLGMTLRASGRYHRTDSTCRHAMGCEEVQRGEGGFGVVAGGNWEPLFPFIH